MFSNTTLGYTKTNDGSVLDETGKILYFSIERFVEDVCLGDCCFLCGASPGSTQFTNEHILPRWLLKRYNLYSKQITLPNLTGHNYDQYVIPCCRSCNALLGREIEEPTQKLVHEGYAAVVRYIKKNGRWLFFLWHCLIFLKTHLKDKSLLQYRDRRKGNETIGEMYDWEALHHIHCVARSIFTGVTLDPAILGSFLLVPAQIQEDIEAFDYSNLYLASSSLIRVDDMCFFAILNDTGTVLPRFRNHLQKIEGPLSSLQIREVFAHLSYINLILKDRPDFFSEFHATRGYRLTATRPDSVTMMDPKKEEFGEVLYYCTRQLLELMGNEDKDQIQEYVRQGDYTFLFDSGGRFIKDSMVRRRIKVDNGQSG